MVSLIVNAAGGLWGASVTSSSRTVLVLRLLLLLLLLLLLPFLLYTSSPYDRRLREHCVTDGIIPAPFFQHWGQYTRFLIERTMSRANHSETGTASYL